MQQAPSTGSLDWLGMQNVDGLGWNVLQLRRQKHREYKSCHRPLWLTTESLLYCYYRHCQRSLTMQSQLMHPGVGSISKKPAASVRTAACAPRPFTLARSHSHSQASRTNRRSIPARSQPENQFDVDTGSAEQLPVELGPRPDDILPDSLADAVAQVRKAGSARGDPRHSMIRNSDIYVLGRRWPHALLQQKIDTGTAAVGCSCYHRLDMQQPETASCQLLMKQETLWRLSLPFPAAGSRCNSSSNQWRHQPLPGGDPPARVLG